MKFMSDIYTVQSGCACTDDFRLTSSHDDFTLFNNDDVVTLDNSELNLTDWNYAPTSSEKPKEDTYQIIKDVINKYANELKEENFSKKTLDKIEAIRILSKILPDLKLE